MINRIIILLLSLFPISNVFSQDVPYEDASPFLESYFKPLAKSIGHGLNNGWYNTAKTHKIAGFDIAMTINVVSVPDEDLYFYPDDIRNFSSSGGNTSPTILGAGDGANITYMNQNNDIVDFTMPDQQLKKNMIPIPMINGGIGLIKQTDINVRYIPTYEYSLGFAGEGSIQLWGLGIKHDLLQWIPIVGDAVPLNLSLQVGHTNLNTQFNIDAAGATQKVDLKVQATTVNLIVSKKILMLTAYAGMGYNTSTTNFDTQTSLTLGTEDSPINFNVPLELEFQSKGELRTDFGFRINLAIITLHLNHSLSKYPVTTFGLGMSIR